MALFLTRSNQRFLQELAMWQNMKQGIFGEHRLSVRKGEKRGYYSAIEWCTALDEAAQQAGGLTCGSERLKLTRTYYCKWCRGMAWTDFSDCISSWLWLIYEILMKSGCRQSCKLFRSYLRCFEVCRNTWKQRKIFKLFFNKYKHKRQLKNWNEWFFFLVHLPFLPHVLVFQVSDS